MSEEMETHKKPSLEQSEQHPASANAIDSESKQTNKTESVSSSKTRRDEGSGGKQRRPRKRRQKTRKWKPYSQMSWEEKQEFQEYENQRMERHLQQMEQVGKRKAIAPYNTTQFLMDDRPSEQPYVKTPPSLLPVNTCPLDSGNESHSSSDGLVPIYEPSPDYLDHDFESAFTNAHASRLDAMSKEELVSHCMGVEKLVDTVQTKLSAFRQVASRQAGDPESPLQTNSLLTELEDALRDSSSYVI